ncbi:helix-turn-helix domain-containing protein [Cereibacter azotoformans]|nr:MerR family transcriptional regulator [Cereibacter azotoformans]ULB09048.1 helix-turn-helix domain-containing protein [Cereibacter azotoformans]
MKLELETYMPSEAEGITEVSQATVRNWRRAGYLPRPKGHARYTIADLLFQVAMRAQVARGVTPEAAAKYSGDIARAMFHSMIWSEKAYSEETYALALATVEIPAARVDRLKEAMGDQFNLATMERLTALGNIAEVAERTFVLAGLKSSNWLIIWANGELEFYYDGDDFEDRFFGETVYDEYVQGPVILFCLGAMAKMVLDRLPRAAIRLAPEAQ